MVLLQLTESQTKCEMLSTQVDSLQNRLSQGDVQHRQLEQRFSILAKNHEEMIRIKDEYKQANQDLQAKHRAHLSQQCERCERLGRELEVSELALSESKQRCATLESDRSSLLLKIKSLEDQTESRNKSAEEQRGDLTKRLNGMCSVGVGMDKLLSPPTLLL